MLYQGSTASLSLPPSVSRRGQGRKRQSPFNRWKQPISVHKVDAKHGKCLHGLAVMSAMPVAT